MPSLREYGPQLLRVMREDRPFRAMITARILTGLFMLAAPFYIGFATKSLDMPDNVAVSQLLLMQTLGSVTGSLIFSWMGIRHTLLFIRLALVAGILQAALALLASVLGPPPLYLAFFAAGVMGGSLGLSFMNWLVVYTTPDQRPIYTGLFNSTSAVTLLVAPLTGGFIVETLGYETVFVAALGFIISAMVVVVRYLKPTPELAI
jgi:predicted MFS family arabinose efflux permease